MAILENLFVKGTCPRKFCTSKISQYMVLQYDYTAEKLQLFNTNIHAHTIEVNLVNSFL